MIEPVSEVEKAERAAIEQKLEEQRATSPLKQQIDALSAAEKAQRQPPQAAEPQPQFQLPEAVLKWLEGHPEFVSDPIRNMELQVAHAKTVRDGVTALEAPEYLPAIEKYLGIASPVAAPPAEAPAPTPATPTPPPQPVYHGGGLVSAPVSREIPSFSTGRPTSESAVKLTAEEASFAKTLGLSPQEYLREKIKIQALKASGAIQ